VSLPGHSIYRHLELGLEDLQGVFRQSRLLIAETDKTPKAKICNTTPSASCPLCNAPNTKVLRHGIREDLETPVFLCLNYDFQFIEPPFDDLREYCRIKKVLSKEEH
jgi:hypothetical protein